MATLVGVSRNERVHQVIALVAGLLFAAYIAVLFARLQ